MIQVLLFDSGRYREPKKARLISVSVIGHGPSIICNGVSVVTQSAANFLMNLASRHPNDIAARYLHDIDAGALSMDLSIGARHDEAFHHDLTVIMEMLAYSLDNIAMNVNPDILSIEKLMDLDDCVSVADMVDCVHEWRTARGMDLDGMRPMEKI